ncbi:MAG TPA: DUF3800 domain-containing protein [Verrucomicrobiae bacterium]|jgi:Protein of unknown function (DUF3800)
MSDSSPTFQNSHRFLDEAGDTTFYGKGKVIVIGQPGVSLAFSLGMAKFNSDLNTLRQSVVELQHSVEADDYLKGIPSVQKKIAKGGFHFHATDDPPEVRERMFKFIKTVDCSLEIVVGRKMPSLFLRKHNGKESEFYADLLSHLVKTKLKQDQKLVLNVAERGPSTKNANLDLALQKAVDRFGKKWDVSEIRSKVVFNVQNPRSEPLLNIADYLCWAVQRVFERGEMRHYDFVREKISLVVDLYDSANYEGSQNYYTRNRPLTAANKLTWSAWMKEIL